MKKRRPPYSVKERWAGIIRRELNYARITNGGNATERFLDATWRKTSEGGYNDKDIQDIILRVGFDARTVAGWYN